MANKRIIEINGEATAANMTDNDYGVIDGLDGTRKFKLSALATWIHSKWAAFVNALTAKTSFASGDKIPVVNGSTASAMEASKLLDLTAQNALAGNVALDFIPNATVTVAGLPYIYNGLQYTAVVGGYKGVWDSTKFVRGNSYTLSPLSQSKEFSVVGANLTLQDAYVPLCKGIRKIKVVLPNPWPTDTIGGSNPNILFVYGVSSDGAATEKRRISVSQVIPEYISIDVSDTDVFLKFSVRANYLAVVSFSVINDIESITDGLSSEINVGRQRIDDANSEIDDLNILTYGAPVSITGNGATAVQSKDYKVEGLSRVTVDFDSNGSWPVTQLLSGTNKFWLQSNSNGTWSSLMEISKDSTAKKFSVDIPPTATKIRFFVRCDTGTTLNGVVTCVADQTTFYLTGRGQATVNKYIKVKPSTEYFLVSDKSWDISGISANSGILNVYASNENMQEVSRLVQVQVPSLPPTKFRFSTPIDCTIIKILFRAADGTKVSFNLVESNHSVVGVGEALDLRSLRNYNGYTLPSLLLMGDPHSSTSAYRDYLSLLNDGKLSGVFNAVVVLGDMASDHPTQQGTYDNFNDFVNSCSKPVYPVIGNHDVGSGYGIDNYCSLEKSVENIMSSAIARGFIPSNTKGYYYRDISPAWNYGMRLIVLNNYNIPGVYDSESLWERVAYDSNAPMIEFSTAYNQGDIVNVGEWTDYSFKAVSSLTTPSASPTTKVHNFPCWETRPDSAKLDAEQAQWLLDTMASAPAYAGIVIAQHSTLSTSCTKDLSNKFTQKDGPALEVSGVGDFLVEAVKAFENKSASFSYTVQGQTVSKDFSGRQSSAAFVGFIGGHEHHDYILRSSTYPKYYEVVANKSMLSYEGDKSDIFTASGAPSATLVSVNRETKSMNLAKLGVTYTQGGYKRDVDVVKQEASPN